MFATFFCIVCERNHGAIFKAQIKDENKQKTIVHLISTLKISFLGIFTPANISSIVLLSFNVNLLYRYRRNQTYTKRPCVPRRLGCQPFCRQFSIPGTLSRWPGSQPNGLPSVCKKADPLHAGWQRAQLRGRLRKELPTKAPSPIQQLPISACAVWLGKLAQCWSQCACAVRSLSWWAWSLW